MQEKKIEMVFGILLQAFLILFLLHCVFKNMVSPKLWGFREVSADADSDGLHHAQSPTMLYTKLDAECDQQVTVVGRLLTAPGHVHCHRQVSSTAYDECCLFVGLGDGQVRCCGKIFIVQSLGVWEVIEGNTFIF